MKMILKRYKMEIKKAMFNLKQRNFNETKKANYSNKIS